MEGNEQGDWAAENEAGCVIGGVNRKNVTS